MDAHVVNLVVTLLAHVFGLFITGERQGLLLNQSLKNYGIKMKLHVLLLSDKFLFSPQVSLPMLLIKSLMYHCHVSFQSKDAFCPTYGTVARHSVTTCDWWH
jgi:hypothetical protein